MPTTPRSDQSTMTTLPNLDELRRLALAATPCPGRCNWKGPYCERCDIARCDYWDAFDPQTVLQLLDALAAKDAECERLTTERNDERRHHEDLFAQYHATARKTCDSLVKQLSAMTAARDEACRIANVALGRLCHVEHIADWQPDLERVTRLRGVGK